MRWMFDGGCVVRCSIACAVLVMGAQMFSENICSEPLEGSDKSSSNVCSAPILCDDGNGGLITLYLARSPDNYTLVKATRWTLEAGWSQPYVLSTQTRSASSLNLVMNKNSKRGLAAWCSFDTVTGIHYVEAVEYDAKTGFAEFETISGLTEDASFDDLKIVLDDNHSKAVLWTITLNSNKQVIRGNTGIFGCGWCGVQQVSD